MPHGICAWPPEVRLEAIRLRGEGKTYPEIEAATGMFFGIARKWCAHVPVGKQGHVIRSILARADNGDSLDCIASLEGCSLKFVVDVLRARAGEDDAWNALALRWCPRRPETRKSARDRARAAKKAGREARSCKPPPDSLLREMREERRLNELRSRMQSRRERERRNTRIRQSYLAGQEVRFIAETWDVAVVTVRRLTKDLREGRRVRMAKTAKSPWPQRLEVAGVDTLVTR